MLKHICLALLGSILFLSLHAQGFQPAFVIGHNGDTIKGEIDYRRWDRNPSTILFRRAGSAQSESLSPIDIQSFSVASEQFESAVVDVDISPYKTNDLSRSSLPEYIRDTVFLQVIVQGKKNLFFLKDKNAKKHFYIKNKDIYEPLIYKQYVQYRGGIKNILKNTGYKSQLSLYLSDCPDIQRKVEQTNYETSALTKLFTFYHECINETSEYVNERNEVKVIFGALAGASLVTLKFDGPDQFEYVVNSEYENSLKPSFGFYVDLQLLRTKGLWISNDIFYSAFEVEGNVTPTNGTPPILSTFHFEYLKTHHQLRADVLSGGRVYAAGGVATGVALKKDVDIRLVSPSIRDFSSKDFEFGLVGTLGSQLGKFNAEVKFEGSNGVSAFPDLSSYTYRLHFFIKYRLTN